MALYTHSWLPLINKRLNWLYRKLARATTVLSLQKWARAILLMLILQWLVWLTGIAAGALTTFMVSAGLVALFVRHLFGLGIQDASV